MTVKATYYAASLDEVADHFVEKATELRHYAASLEKRNHTPKKDYEHKRIEAQVWDSAARVIRNTVIGVEPKPFSQAMCDHSGYTTFGRQNYPWSEDRGPYCPACDEIVEL